MKSAVLLGVVGTALFVDSAGAQSQVPDGLSASDWSSIRAAYDANRHAAFAVEGGYQSRNPGQQWRTRFDGRGFVTTPDTGGWSWGLELVSYGVEGAEREVVAPTCADASGQRVTYEWGEHLTEWYVNDRRGLEHGYTVHQRPNVAQPPSAVSELRFTLAVRGDLDPRLSVDGRGVTFVNAGGAAVVTYTGLTVFDATGATLPAWFENAPLPQASGLKPQAFQIVVDDSNATYPLTIDPISQQVYLKASNTDSANISSDQFGISVAVSGDTVVVGASQEDSNATGVNGNQADNTATGSGAAYVFVRNGTNWSQQAYLKASNTGVTDQFGWSVGVSGDTVVVGAHSESSIATGVNGNQADNSATLSGAAYVFVRSGGIWSQEAYLKASNTGASDFFGYSVAVDGNTVVVGAYQEDSSATGINGDEADNSASQAGAAYVFVRSAGVWSQQAYLKASNTGADDQFGFSVAASDDTLVVGAYREDSSAIGVNGNQADNSASASGATYVFVRSGGVWSQQAYLKASNTAAADFFGRSVAISVDTVVVGAIGEDSSATGVNGNQANNSVSGSGAAYVFVRSGTTWSQQSYLKASNTGGGDQFGYSVTVSGDTVVVGANTEDSSATGVNGNQADNGAGESGAAYVFVRSGGVWSQEAYLKASNTGAGDVYGESVAVSGDTVVVGSWQEDSSATGVNGDQADNSALNAGAAYVFVRSGAVWSQEAYVKASNAGVTSFANDNFGSSVSVSNDTVVVGAPQEDSNATGVDGNQADNSASGSGAAYVFVRSGGVWSQQAYLKASNTGADDQFGFSVAASDDTVVVGAFGEDSNTYGVDGNQADNSAPGSGAAYVFVRTGGVWSQQAYIKASNTDVNDFFGLSVAISGDTVVVGARGEDSLATGVDGNQADNSVVQAGAAYVFVRSGGVWSQQAYLKASNTGANDFFGGSVAVSGDTVVVGAYGEDSSATGVDGNQGDNSDSGSGAAYLFLRSGTVWSQQAYLKASNTGVSDEFGLSVAVAGDTVVVGAYGEDSSATGVDGNQADNSASNSGAAYVFVRSPGAPGSWSQQAYLKASNTGAIDFFGWSVAASGDTVLVGAFQEASSATGVDGNQADNSVVQAGAAYVFVRSGGVWSQQAYLKASNTGASDQFGWSVSVSGDTVVVGANFEDSSATGVNGNQSDNNGGESGAAYVFAGVGCPTLANMNCDCAVDELDVEPFVLALIDPAGYATTYPLCDINRGDMQPDTNVDGGDVQGFVNLLIP